jgi:hypothetical protein
MTFSTSELNYVQPNALQINGKNGEAIMIVGADGSLQYRSDGELKIVECDKELSLLFVTAISGITGFSFIDKEELYKTISQNFRNGRIDDIFNKNS